MTNIIPYTPLHLHTEYSLLDGIIRIPQLVKHLKANGISSCGISDHGVLSGIVDFYKAMKEVELKPLLGMEAYTTFDEDGIEDNKDKTRDNMHAVLIAMNENGLANLIEMNNRAHLHNFYYKPRVSFSNLTKLGTDIICTTACLGGVVSKLGVFDEGNKTFNDPEGFAKKQLEVLLKIFGDRLYAEIQAFNTWEQEAYNQWLIKQANDMSIPLVITSDAHFLTGQDYETHKLIMAKNTGKTLAEYKSDEDGLVYQREHCVQLPEQMLRAAQRLGAEEAYYNTNEIAKRCDVEIVLGQHQFPTFKPENEEDYQDFLQWEKDGHHNSWITT